MTMGMDHRAESKFSYYSLHLQKPIGYLLAYGARIV